MSRAIDALQQRDFLGVADSMEGYPPLSEGVAKVFVHVYLAGRGQARGHETVIEAKKQNVVDVAVTTLVLKVGSSGLVEHVA